MFFVVKGELEVLKGTGAKRERLGFIGPGGFFGENCIIEVRALMHTRVHCKHTRLAGTGDQTVQCSPVTSEKAAIQI
jgi:hypothetical protein